MSRIVDLIMRTISLVRQIPGRWLRRKKVHFSRIEFGLDIPQRVEDNTVYISGKLNNEWCASFVCPCGCKEVVHLNLLHGTNPRWSYSIAHERISIWPSVRRVVGCHSHYHITDGNVYLYDD